MMNNRYFRFYLFVIILMQACTVNRTPIKDSAGAIHLITLAPGHFHAALLQKYRHDEVDPTVYVF
ncbi:MAG: oxidoreductase, partial [Bacteroidota bacterium]